MPYVTKDKRVEMSSLPLAKDPGELNYLVTMICLRYLTSQELRYHTLNTIVGALECAKQEFVRRVVSPYEDDAMFANGDVYDRS